MLPTVKDEFVKAIIIEGEKHLVFSQNGALYIVKRIGMRFYLKSYEINLRDPEESGEIYEPVTDEELHERFKFLSQNVVKPK